MGGNPKSGSDNQIQNQKVVRSANERLYTVAVGAVPADGLVPFLCECADGLCLGRVEMKASEYDDIHRDRSRYSVLRGHQLATGERVVEQRSSYDVVSKEAA